MRIVKSSRIVTIAIIALIVFVSLLLFREIMIRRAPARGVQQAGVQAGPGPQAGGQAFNIPTAAGRAASAVRVTPVVMGTIENSVIINGDVLAARQISLFPTVGGRVSETRFQVGDWVGQGAVVAMIDPSRPGEVFSHSPVSSTISGTILQSPVSPGDTVSTQTPVYIVGDLSSLVVETFVPERFSNSARRGLPAQVFLEALPGETFQAVVDEVSPVLDPASRTVRIRLRFSGTPDPRIRAGMFATVSLVTNTRQNVPIIPRGAVINTYGSWICFVVDDRNIAQRREVFLGLENENFLEILEGLNLGEQVVTAGQNFLTHGELVRIVD